MDKYILVCTDRDAKDQYIAVKVNGLAVIGSYKMVKKELDLLNKGVIRFPHFKMMRVNTASKTKAILEQIGVDDIE